MLNAKLTIGLFHRGVQSILTGLPVALAGEVARR